MKKCKGENTEIRDGAEWCVDCGQRPEMHESQKTQDESPLEEEIEKAYQQGYEDGWEGRNFWPDQKSMKTKFKEYLKSRDGK